MVRRGLQEWPELDADDPKDRWTARAAYTGLQSERNKQDNQELKLTLKEARKAVRNDALGCVPCPHSTVLPHSTYRRGVLTLCHTRRER
jgi:hypothetical protein